MNLNAPQHAVLQLGTKHKAFVAGFGGSKTFTGCIDNLLFFANNKSSNERIIKQGHFGISYPSIRDIYYPTIEEVAHMLGFTVDIKEGNKEVHVYRNGFYYGTTICRSMDAPAGIIGFKIARAHIDEIDVLPTDKAKQAWQKIIARLRLKIDGVVNGTLTTTTPEGFKFVYQKFKKNPTSAYSMVQASTVENAEYLPDDYISDLKEDYSEELIEAYLHGQFVNLTSGTVYKNFDRATCSSSETVKGNERIFVGMDFNVYNMSAVIHVKRCGAYHAVDEIANGEDTPAIIDLLRERYPDNQIIIYPDASGKNSSSKGAGISDVSMLKDAKFSVRAKDSNPRVKDRVNAMNMAFTKGMLKINTHNCPEYVSCLEQQAYAKNGEPDKTAGFDHMNDAGGYLIAYEIPVFTVTKAQSFDQSVIGF